MSGGLPIFAIRPEPGLSATRAAARALGLTVEGSPLFEVGPCDWRGPDGSEVDALLAGSANAFRHGGPELKRFTGMPAYVVGERTADAARDAGFPVAAAGTGGLQGVLDGLAGKELRLLRIAGKDHVLLDPPAGIAIVTRIAYASTALEMPPGLARRLHMGGVVLLHSAGAARHFRAECRRLGISPGGLRIAALGPRILEAAGEGWGAARAAELPREEELLALAGRLCH